MNLNYIAVFVLNTACTLYKISIHQTNLIAREHTEIFLWRFLHEIICLNVKLSAKRNCSASKLWVFKVINNIKFFHLILWVVINN